MREVMLRKAKPCSVVIRLDFKEASLDLVACVVNGEVRIMCDDSFLLIQGWLVNHADDVLQIVRQSLPHASRIKIYSDSHKV